MVRRFPLYYERYIEVFDGGGWILFHKNPGNDFEVYSDFNGLLTNLYRCVREKPDLLISSLRHVLNARGDFDRAWSILRRKRTTLIQRVAWFHQIICQSYTSALTNFGNQPHDLWVSSPLIEQTHRRLARAVIKSKDFEKLTRHYNRPGSLLYCDPSYHCTEGYYPNIREDGFTEKDHIRLQDTLLSIQDKFLLSYNDDGFIRELYDTPGIQIEPVTRLNDIRQRYDPNRQLAELFITNYNLHERGRSSVQLSLFDSDMKETDYEICKRNHFQGPPDSRDNHGVLWL